VHGLLRTFRPLNLNEPALSVSSELSPCCLGCCCLGNSSPSIRRCAFFLHVLEGESCPELVSWNHACLPEYLIIRRYFTERFESSTCCRPTCYVSDLAEFPLRQFRNLSSFAAHCLCRSTNPVLPNSHFPAGIPWTCSENRRLSLDFYRTLCHYAQTPPQAAHPRSCKRGRTLRKTVFGLQIASRAIWHKVGPHIFKHGLGTAAPSGDFCGHEPTKRCILFPFKSHACAADDNLWRSRTV